MYYSSWFSLILVKTLVAVLTLVFCVLPRSHFILLGYIGKFVWNELMIGHIIDSIQEKIDIFCKIFGLQLLAFGLFVCNFESGKSNNSLPLSNNTNGQGN